MCCVYVVRKACVQGEKKAVVYLRGGGERADELRSFCRSAPGVWPAKRGGVEGAVTSLHLGRLHIFWMWRHAGSESHLEGGNRCGNIHRDDGAFTCCGTAE